MSSLPFLLLCLWYLSMCAEKTLPSELDDRSEFDVVIVGGGIAGLGALENLVTNGVSNVILLEAQDYFGGRIKTFRKGDLIIEEGAQWIHGNNNPVYSIAQKLSAFSDTLPDEAYYYTLRRSDGTSNDIDDKILGRLERYFDDSLVNGELEDLYSHGYGQYFEDRLEEDPLISSLSPDLKAAWLHYGEQRVNAEEGTDDWNDISARDADNFVDLGEDFCWKDGFDTIINYLLERIPKEKLLSSTPVEKILWRKPELNGKVEIQAKGGKKFIAKKVLVTISVEYLKQYQDELFHPPLPNELKNALKYINLGNSNKVILHWDEPWWGSTKHLDVHILWTERNMPPEMKWVEGIVEMFSLQDSPSTLVGFVTGNYSSEMEALPEENVKQHLITLLGEVMNMTIPQPSFFKRSKWSTNPWTLGSYGSFISVEGALNGLHSRSIFAKPIRNSVQQKVLFFGGEHTSTRRYGTADGAYASGLRESKKIRKLLSFKESVLQSYKESRVTSHES